MPTMGRNALVGAALLLGCASWARCATCDTTESTANRHFQDAISLLDRGEIEAAISEFEEALRVRPHFKVLYDLGHAYALAGRPVEAADALRRYLDEGGTRIDDQRRAEVLAAIRLYEGLIGTLVVDAPAGSTVVLDGRTVPTKTPLRIRAGRHGILTVIDDRPTTSKAIDVAAGKTTAVVLEPPPGSELGPVAPGWVQFYCDVPDVGITIDGKTPPLMLGAEPVALTPGTHELLFSRNGYQSRQLSVVASSSELMRLTCGLEPQRDLTPSRGAPLKIGLSPPSATIVVDGSPYQGESLPFGRHRASVFASGFEPWGGFVNLSPVGASPASITLGPTEQSSREQAARAGRLRTWGYVTAGGAVVAGAIATGLFVLQSRQTADWRADRAALLGELAQAPATPAQLRLVGEQAQRAADIQRTGDAALGLAVTAGALVAVSVGLFWASAHSKGWSNSRARLELGKWSF